MINAKVRAQYGGSIIFSTSGALHYMEGRESGGQGADHRRARVLVLSTLIVRYGDDLVTQPWRAMRY